MADYLANLEDVYNKMYNSKQAALNNDKNQKFAGLDSQQQALINQYQELQNNLNAKKQGVEAQYKGLYTGLDNQQQQGKEQYYNDRNSAALSNAQKSQQIRDYMARNNLLSSGENVDAMLRSNTDYNNNLGNIYSAENQFNRGIADKRNQYSLAEQGAYTDISNQLGAADREKTQKLSDISNQRKLLESSFLNELQSYRDQLNAQKSKEIGDYNERLRQEEVQRQEAEKQRQWQAQQAAAQRAAQQAAQRASAQRSASSRSNGLSNSMSSGSSYNKAVADINDVVNGKYNLSEKQRVLQRYIDDLGSQQGNEAAALNRYAQDALGKVNQQMSSFVNSGRYAGYENRRM